MYYYVGYDNAKTMNHYFSQLFDGLYQWSSDHYAGNQHKLSRLDLSKRTEYIVDKIDPKIRVIYRYAQRLSKPIRISENYLHNLSDLIPGELSVNANNLTLDPRIQLFFKSPKDMQNIFSNSLKLKEYLSRNNNQNLQHVSALLCMNKTERTTFGVALKGEILLREVKQKTIRFSNHRLIAPAANAEEARQGFKLCALDELLAKINNIIMLHNKNYQQLVNQKAELLKTIKLKYNDPSIKSSNVLSPHSWVSTHPELQRLEKEINIQKIDIASPEHHLEQICEILSHPEKYITVDITTFILDKLGVILDSGTQKNSIKLELAEVSVDQISNHFSVIIKYPISELQ